METKNTMQATRDALEEYRAAQRKRLAEARREGTQLDFMLPLSPEHCPSGAVLKSEGMHIEGVTD